MAINTIIEPSADQQMKDLYNRRMRQHTVVVVDPGEKLAVVLLRLHPGVDQPGNYATLKFAIEAITGIQNVKLLVDGQCPASIPVDTELHLATEVHMQIHDVPKPPLE